MSTVVTQYSVDFVPSTGASLTGVPIDPVPDAAKPKFNSFQITRKIDRSSPSLFTMCTTGAHFKKVTIYLRKAGGSGKSGSAYLTYTMTNCTVTGYSRTSGTETISFGFGQMISSGVPTAAAALA